MPPLWGARSMQTIARGAISQELQTIKKSRFIAFASYASTLHEAKSFVEVYSDPKATHNCWAFQGRSQDENHCSDDGEPNNTAGKPILAAIQGEGLRCVVGLVVRHFGGTKLGTGGLIRAYGGVARECLRKAPKTIFKQTMLLEYHVEICDIGQILRAVSRCEGVVREENYGENGLRLSVEVEEELQPRLHSAVIDASSGRARLLTHDSVNVK